MDRIIAGTTLFEFIAAGAAALAALYAGWQWGWPLAKRWGVRWLSFWTGFDTVPLIHGALADLAEGIARIEAAALVESSKGTERGTQIEAQGLQLASIAKNLALTNMTMRATLATDPRMGTFEADVNGLLIDCSKTYLRWTGRQFNEMRNWGWITTVHPDDRARVRLEWEQAVVDSRQSVMRYRMIGVDGNVFEVEATATPIPEGMLPCEKFVGVVHRLQDE